MASRASLRLHPRPNPPSYGSHAARPFRPINDDPCYRRRVQTPPDEPTANPSEPTAPAARTHPKDLLHGVTLKSILEQLHAHYGWEHLGRIIPIRCFTHEPSMGSSLAFLRRQPWARSEVEALFIRYEKGQQRLAPRAADTDSALPADEPQR